MRNTLLALHWHIRHCSSCSAQFDPVRAEWAVRFCFIGDKLFGQMFGPKRLDDAEPNNLYFRDLVWRSATREKNNA